VLRDALFAGPGSADLLLPRVSLSAMFPLPAARWLEQAGAALRWGRRVQSLEPDGDGWRVDGERFDRVLLAAPPGESARLVGAIDPAWSAQAAALRYEPIVTVYARSDGTQLSEPMLALACDAQQPAQFVFDRGQLGGPAGLLAFVVSASSEERETLERQVLAQAREQLGQSGLSPLLTVVEKRATFACTPGLERPAARIAPGLLACGDYVEGPYPATIEGAVRSGMAAGALGAS